MYWVRFRLPRDVAVALECTELRRSLGVKDLADAKKRCLACALWFQSLMDTLRRMPSPSTADLETAAEVFFARLRGEASTGSLSVLSDYEIDRRLRTSDERMVELDRQLVTNEFDVWVVRSAEQMCAEAGLDISASAPSERMLAQKLAARAERAKLTGLIHDLTSPGVTFVPSDDLFIRAHATSSPSPRPPHGTPGLPLKKAAELYLQKLRDREVGTSHVTETARALKWLGEVAGDSTGIDAITSDDLRSFRDGISQMARLQGRDIPFAKRKARSSEERIKSVTAIRYWSAVRAFFKWTLDERHLHTDPVGGLRIDKRKGEKRASPEPFSPEELRKLAQTPLYRGYRSLTRVNDPGALHTRTGKWWSMILLLYTGMRAGEASQLLPEDFRFDEPVSHIKVREIDDQGRKVKTVKTEASIRDVPIHSDLLALGLRQFVERRGKAYAGRPVFWEFRPGADGRSSDGMTKFWGAYLRKHDLWKMGRATHVGRHTVVHYLREAGVPDEHSGAIVGHAGKNFTALYGGASSLTRKSTILAKLDFGFDFIATLGGPYQKGRHGE